MSTRSKDKLKQKTKNDARDDLGAEQREAYEKTAPQRSALRPEDIIYPRVDVFGSIRIALGAAPQIAVYRPEIATLPGHIEKAVDALRPLAFAAWHAYVLATPTAIPGRPMTVVLKDGHDRRELLLVALEALEAKGLVPEGTCRGIREGKGTADLVRDLDTLCLLFRDGWTRFHGKTAIEMADVERAEESSAEILLAGGHRAVPGPDQPGAAKDDVARAMTLLFRAYEQCRRAITFIRWHEGDADTIAPSLFRRASRRAPSDVEAPDGSAPTVENE